jgi:hypothetical protein
MELYDRSPEKKPVRSSYRNYQSNSDNEYSYNIPRQTIHSQRKRIREELDSFHHLVNARPTADGNVSTVEPQLDQQPQVLPEYFDSLHEEDGNWETGNRNWNDEQDCDANEFDDFTAKYDVIEGQLL